MATGADDSDGPVCRFHPNTPAATRCYACHLPLCAACVVEAAGLAFCSRACANRHATGAVELEDANARVAAAMRRAWWRRAVRAVFVLAVVAAGLWLVWTVFLTALILAFSPCSFAASSAPDRPPPLP